MLLITALLKFKQKITGETKYNGTINVKIMVPLNYVSSFWRTFEMSLIFCEINVISTWSDESVLSNNTKATDFAISDAKLYVLTVCTQDNVKLLQELKSGFKRTIN